MSVCLRYGFLRSTYIACLGVLVAGLWFVPFESALAHALTIEDESSQGRVTIQGGSLEAIESIEEDVIESIDYKEEMRLFIQDISQFSRNYNPNFVVIVENALELLTKTDFTDEELVMPARTYIRSIDGVMEVGLFHGTP